MSITLAPRNTVTMDEIDAEIDRFNDAMKDLGYEATVRHAQWGEPVIEVHADAAEPVAEFWSTDACFLDNFSDYANRTIDATSIARAETQAAWDRMFPGTEDALASLIIRSVVVA